MAGKPGSWAKGQKIVKTVDLTDGTTAEGIVIVDSDGNVAGGTGGGPATIANGADVAQGNTADAAWVSGSGTVISLLKAIAGGGGGSAVTVADGADVAQGATTDASSSNTVIGLLKNIKATLAAGLGRTWTLSSGTDSVAATVSQATGTNLHAVVDSGTISTITNAVHVDDNAGSLTVDAPVGTPVFSRLSDGSAALIGQKAAASSLPVTIASDQSTVPVSLTSTTVTGTVHVDDNAGSLTVDAPVGTPVFVRLSDGSSAIATLPVSLASLPGTAADAATALPSVSMLMAGWDGLNVQTVTVTPLDGEHMMSVRDPIIRRVLEEILLELRVMNENLATALPNKTRMDGPLIAGQEFR